MNETVYKWIAVAETAFMIGVAFGAVVSGQTQIWLPPVSDKFTPQWTYSGCGGYPNGYLCVDESLLTGTGDTDTYASSSGEDDADYEMANVSSVPPSVTLRVSVKTDVPLAADEFFVAVLRDPDTNSHCVSILLNDTELTGTSFTVFSVTDVHPGDSVQGSTTCSDAYPDWTIELINRLYILIRHTCITSCSAVIDVTAVGGMVYNPAQISTPMIWFFVIVFVIASPAMILILIAWRKRGRR